MNGSLNNIVRIIRAKTFRENIANARRLQYSANCSTSNQSSSSGCWLQHHSSRAVSTNHFVWNGRTFEADHDQTFFGLCRKSCPFPIQSRDPRVFYFFCRQRGLLNLITPTFFIPQSAYLFPSCSCTIFGTAEVH